MQKTYKYKAFISYSHKDKSFAKWLHKRIENYKIPKSLREKYPNLPKDLKRSLFIDEQELPTSSVLGNDLTNALDNSEKLIVICSPHSVASKWVNEEIRYFKEVHGEFSVLAILKSGEPKASISSVSDSNQEAFPKSLLYKVDENGKLTDQESEPLAGDARSYWGREMALMKMIAGVLGVDFADLWVREKKEALKRKVIKGFVALCLVGALGFTYYYATENQEIKGYGTDYMKTVQIVSQKRALLLTDISDEQKNKINENIKKLERKLSDIKEATKAISKIDGAFAQEALHILKRQGAKEALDFINSKESIDDEEKMLVKLADKHRVRANVYIANQKYDEAILSYEKVVQYDFSYDNVSEYMKFSYTQNNFKRSIELCEKLLKIKLSKEKKGKTLNSLAVLYQKVNRVKEAEKAYVEALGLRRALAKKNPLAYNADIATTLNNLATLYYKVNKVKGAEEAYVEALALYKALAKKDPLTYNVDVAMTLNNLAILYYKVNQVKEAKKAFFKALALYRALAKKNPLAYNAYVAMNLNSLATLYYKVNKVKEAEEAYVEALALRRALAKKNPLAYNADVAGTLNNLGGLYAKVNKVKEAEKKLVEALGLNRALAKKNPLAYNAYVARTLNNLALLYDKVNKVKEAEEAYVESLGLRRALAKKNPLAYNADIAMTLNNLANLYKKVNKVKEAEEAYVEALGLRRVLGKKNHLAYNADVAETLNNLAILYDKVNKVKEAEEAYVESLGLRRALAKKNPNVYALTYAQSLVMGVDYFNIPVKRLDEAEKILENFRGLRKADGLLGIIETLRAKSKKQTKGTP